MTKKKDWSNDADVLAEGRKYASRSEFRDGSSGAYKAACLRKLIDQLYPSKNDSRSKWSNDADVLAEGRKYASRAEFALRSGSAYNVAHKRGLLDQLYQKQYGDWSKDADVMVAAQTCASRKEFQKKYAGAYKAASQRNLLDQLYPSKVGDWSNDADVLAEGRKYASRAEFKLNAKGAYAAASRRNLLDRMNWFDRAPSNNDAIYIWRAIGQHHNGNPIYKIGVTSARLGTVRIEQVAKDSGFEFDLICCEPVQCKATELERKLHLLGENPNYTGFGGCTEFRALSDSALYAAVSMICNQL